jgi:hypothetical protein
LFLTAIEVVALDHDVAEIDADAEHEPAVGRQLGVACAELLLDGDRTAHRLDGAGELGQHAVAGGADDPSVMARDEILHRLPIGGKRAQRPFLVRTHQAGVARHIGAEDRGELASYAGCRHRRPGIGEARTIALYTIHDRTFRIAWTCDRGEPASFVRQPRAAATRGRRRRPVIATTGEVGATGVRQVAQRYRSSDRAAARRATGTAWMVPAGLLNSFGKSK